MNALSPYLKDGGFLLWEIANIFGQLIELQAVLPLMQTLRRLKKAGMHPNTPERLALRTALTALGVRQECYPVSIAQDAVIWDYDWRIWPWIRLANIIETLATHSQVLLSFIAWDEQRQGVQHGQWKNESMLDLPWAQEVKMAKDGALEEALTAPVFEDAWVSVDWIQISDL